jgi:hypothetical protein
LLASNDALRREVLDYFGLRFGIPPAAFAEAAFVEPSSGEIWITSALPPSGLRPRRPPGLRALRRAPAGLKPTSAFLVSIGPLVTASRLSLDADAVRQLLLGRRIPCSHSDGYVALAHDGLIFGCGLVADGIVHCLIPTGRRRELLDVFDT